MIFSEAAVRRLLDLLCVKLGFCLGPEPYRTICEQPPVEPRAFTDAVIVAEGLDPVMLRAHLYRQVLSMVEAAFHAERLAQEEALVTEPSGALFEVVYVGRKRDGYVLCRELGTGSFDVEQSALNGHPIKPVVSQPRTLYATGAPRFDIYAFHLENAADLARFKLGQLVVLARVRTRADG